MSDRITSLVVTVQPDGLYSVASEAGPIMAADALTRDEALGCLASWIYAHRDYGTPPQFMRTPEQAEAARVHFEEIRKRIRDIKEVEALP